jgi:hypothetical protein
MEFEHVGKHCEFDGCHQKDFLPFKCPLCKRNLCLEHRRFSVHGCVPPDATSMDCPICTKSIRMDRSDDPNEVWSLHYASSCTQQPAAPRPSVTRCSAPNCNIALGPSNSFSCGKCFSKVCLGHRMPEDHNCDKVRRSRAVPVGAKAATAHPVGAPPSKGKTPSGRGSGSDSSNSLMGTAARRANKLTTTAVGSSEAAVPPPASESISCPICSEHFHSVESVTTHIERQHQSSPAPPLPPRIAASAAALRERCPVCGDSFEDVVQLIAHNETAHRPQQPVAARAEVCPVCGESFADIMLLIAHSDSAHSPAVPASNSNCSIH